MTALFALYITTPHGGKTFFIQQKYILRSQNEWKLK